MAARSAYVGHSQQRTGSACIARNGAVYEPFCGSGTSIIAAETIGRICHAIEIDPGYVDVAVERWQKFTGERAFLDGDGGSFSEVATARGTASVPETKGSADPSSNFALSLDGDLALEPAGDGR